MSTLDTVENAAKSSPSVVATADQLVTHFQQSGLTTATRETIGGSTFITATLDFTDIPVDKRVEYTNRFEDITGLTIQSNEGNIFVFQSPKHTKSVDEGSLFKSFIQVIRNFRAVNSLESTLDSFEKGDARDELQQLMQEI